MDRKSLSVALASGLGALIGGLVAAQLAQVFHFYELLAGIAGMIAGGSVAYCAIDFRHLCSGVARAYKNTLAWKPYGPYWKTVGMNMIPWGMVGAYILGGMFFLLVGTHGNTLAHITPITRVFSAGWLISTLGLGFQEASMSTGTHTVNEFGRLRLLVRSQRRSSFLAKWANPVMLPIGITIVLYRLTVWTLPILLSFLEFVCKAPIALNNFIRTAFLFVHSERRLVCMVNAGLGTAVGFLGFHPHTYANALIGMVAGGLFGLIDYQVVSISLLKLSPTR
jgi:hypothetical protein